MNKVFSKWSKEFDPNVKPQLFHAFCKACSKWVYEMHVKAGKVICTKCKEILGDSKGIHYQMREVDSSKVEGK